MKGSLIASFCGERTSENAWPEDVGRGRFDSRARDEVAGNAEVVACVTLEVPAAGETDATTYDNVINDHGLLFLL
jgi:hypothetical protein